MATCISVARSRSTWGSAGRRAAAIFARWASALTDTRKLYCVDGSSGGRVKAGTGTKLASSNVSLKAPSGPSSRESTLGTGGGAGRRAVGIGVPSRKGGRVGYASSVWKSGLSSGEWCLMSSVAGVNATYCEGWGSSKRPGRTGSADRVSGRESWLPVKAADGERVVGIAAGIGFEDGIGEQIQDRAWGTGSREQVRGRQVQERGGEAEEKQVRERHKMSRRERQTSGPALYLCGRSHRTVTCARG